MASRLSPTRVALTGSSKNSRGLALTTPCAPHMCRVVFRRILPNSTGAYEYEIPHDHSPGQLPSLPPSNHCLASRRHLLVSSPRAR